MALALSGLSVTGTLRLAARLSTDPTIRDGNNYPGRVYRLFWATSPSNTAVGSLLEGSVDYDDGTNPPYTLLGFIGVRTTYQSEADDTASSDFRFYLWNSASAEFPADGGIDDVMGSQNITIVKDGGDLITFAAGSHSSAGAGWGYWRDRTSGTDTLTAAQRAFIESIATDPDEIIIAIHSGTATYTQPPEALSMSAAAGDPTAAFNLDALAPFPISNFSATGHVALLAKIQAGRSARTGGDTDQIHLYATDGFTPAVGSIVEGNFDYDAETGTDYANLLRRIAINVNDGGFFILNRHTGSAADLDAIANVEAVTVVRNTDPPTLITLEANSNDNGNTGFVDWRANESGLSSEEWAFLNAIQAGDEFIIALHTGVASYAPPIVPAALSMSAEAGSPTAAFALHLTPIVSITTPPQTIDAGVTIQLNATAIDPDGGALTVEWSGLGTFSNTGIATPTWEAPSPAVLSVYNLRFTATDDEGSQRQAFLAITVRGVPHALSMAAEAGDPTAAFDLTAIPPTIYALSIAARAGNPTATFDLRAVPPGAPEALSMSARAGSPTAVFSLGVIPPSLPLALAMAARAGMPTAAFNLRAIAPLPTLELSMAARGGLPAVLFNLRVVSVDEAEDRVTRRVATTERTELLVLQWQGTRLEILIEGILALVREKLVVPLAAMEFGIDDAEGWQLDAIGSWVGLPRPNIRATDVAVFGFEGAGAPVVGFDQGYFRSVDERLSPSQGIADGLYRRMLKMQGRLLRSRYTIPELDAAVQEVIPHAVYRDHGDGDLTLYIGDEQLQRDKDVLADYWPRPATVQLTVNDTVALPI